jgi:hypothetical protein
MKGLSQQKRRMVKNLAGYIEEILPVEEKIRGIIKEEKVEKGDGFFYFSFGYEVSSIARHYKGKARENEIEIRKKKWLIRGLKEEVLKRIEEAIIG